MAPIVIKMSQIRTNHTWWDLTGAQSSSRITFTSSPLKQSFLERLCRCLLIKGTTQQQSFVLLSRACTAWCWGWFLNQFHNITDKAFLRSSNIFSVSCGTAALTFLGSAELPGNQDHSHFMWSCSQLTAKIYQELNKKDRSFYYQTPTFKGFWYQSSGHGHPHPMFWI